MEPVRKICIKVEKFLKWWYIIPERSGILMKKFILSSVVFIGLALIVQADEPIKVTLNEQLLVFDQPPIVEEGRSLVPMRAIFEAMGAAVEWKDDTQSAIATKDDKKIIITVDNKVAYVNGEPHSLDVPAKVLNGRTLVPVRFVSEMLDCNVDWDEETQTVVIKSIVNAVKNGYGKEYNSDGKLIYEGNLENGFYSGQGKQYYAGGSLRYEGNWKEGLKYGQGKLYYESGCLLYEGNFKDSQYDGYGKMYYENGVLAAEGYFKDGLLNGETKVYDENGFLIFEGLSVNGEPVGKNYAHTNSNTKNSTDTKANSTKTYAQELDELNDWYTDELEKIEEKSQEVYNSVMKQYGFDESKTNSNTESSASGNGGNIDSFAAANMKRQKEAALNSATLSAISARDSYINTAISLLKDTYNIKLSALNSKYNMR